MNVQREPISAELRNRILKRDGHKCRYCGSVNGPFHIDHVYPVIKGGETSYDNLVMACQRCNLRKHSKVGLWPMPVGYFDIMSEAEHARFKLNQPSPYWMLACECAGLMLASLHTWITPVVNWPHWVYYFTLSTGLAIFLFFFSLQLGWGMKK